MPRLTIGMATFDDFNGVVFTCQALALYSAVTDPVEIIVVDNNPSSNHGAETAKFCASGANRPVWPIRYIAMPESTGTTQPRERIFAEARGDIVLVMDPHVLFVDGAIRRLLQWYDDNPHSLDLVSGPLLYDDLKNISSHFNETWSAEMEGQWALDERAWVRDHAAFEVPGQGLGVFSCRKSAWLGFNPHFRGFGGEELYVHRKFRKAGRRTLCLPFLVWWHRFGRPDGVQYPIPRYSKVRNYVLGHQELGMDVAPIFDHFVRSGLLPVPEWEHLLADPIKNENPPGCASCGKETGTFGRPQPPPQLSTIEEIYQWSKHSPRDMEQLYDTMRGFIEKCAHVTEFSKRRETTIVLLGSRPKVCISYNSERDEIYERLHAVVSAERITERFTTNIFVGDPSAAEIEPTDLLLVHSLHHGERLFLELEKHSPNVSRFIMLRSTGAFGELAEDGKGPGLLVGMRRFLQRHPEWSVLYHTQDQYGLTVLGKFDEDKPKLPSLATMAFNVTAAYAKHVASGFSKVSEEVLQSRLARCTICVHRSNERCTVCGCPIEEKAIMGTQECPLGFWV